MTALPKDVTADLERRVAELERRLHSVAGENARLQSELTIARDRQNASVEILRTVANASGDAEQSLQRIAEITARLFDAPSVTIQIAEDDGWSHTIRFGDNAKRVGATVPVNQLRIGGRNMPGTIVAENRQIHVPDLDNVDPAIADWPGLPPSRAAGTRTMAGTPLRREGKAIGVLIVYLNRLAPFTEEELALQQSFADQAAIAIENSRLFLETQQALEQQKASADILRVVSNSVADTQPVFDEILRSIEHLFDAEERVIFLAGEDGLLHIGATHGPNSERTRAQFPAPLESTASAVAMRERRLVSSADVFNDPDIQPAARERARRFGKNYAMVVAPMLWEDRAIGSILVARSSMKPFVEKECALLRTFAQQAVIAIQNARLFNETREALERQTATADVLKVIASTPADVQPVFDAIASSARRLLGGFSTTVLRFIGEELHLAAYTPTNAAADQALKSAFPRLLAEFPTFALVRNGETVQFADTEAPDVPPANRDLGRLRGFRSVLFTPLMNQGMPVGMISVTRAEPGAFAHHHVQLLQTFADQAVIAIENVRLFNEVKQRTNDLTEALTYQTGSGNILRVIASSPTDVQPVLKAIVESACELCEADDALATLKEGDELVFQAQHGSIPVVWNRQPIDRYGAAGLAVIDRTPVHVHDLLAPEGEQFPRAREFARLTNVRTVLCVPLLREGESIGVIVLRRTEVRPFSDKQIALLQTFADQAVIAIGNVRLFEQVQARTRELAASLDELRTAQDRLVQTEKLASLGQLTAGIAHEIKNPLNFVNNFAALSAELTDELNDVLKPATISEKIREEVDELTGLLKDNLQKVVQHGKRADSIVKNMLLHSREGSGDHRPADINALIDESLNLAYHGARAEKPNFNVTLQRDFDPSAGLVELFPQEITRVFLNLVSNGFYAVTKRRSENDNPPFDPVLSVTTRNLGDTVEIRIRDNGTGIPPEVKDKMFNPFFTTKPAGEGTGLGLSMSHDIVVKQHGGTIDVATEPGQFTEFTIVLPRTGGAPRKIQ